MNKEGILIHCPFCGEKGGCNTCCELLDGIEAEYRDKPVWLL